MKKKILAVLLSAAMVAAMAMGCSSGGGSSAKSDGESKGKAEDMTFVVVPKCVHAWFDEVNKGAQKEADLLSEQLGVDVKIDYRAPESAEVSAQNSTLEQAAATNPMLMSMGGASGVIFGSLYLAGAKGMDPKSVITSKDLADMEKKSLEAIQERGGAQVGDKTMVDALSPAVDALAANADKGLLEMLKAAEASAKQGVEDTKKYVAKFGRAKSLLERAIGHQDAGATSVYLIFQGMREFVEGKLA